ncbi:MAG: 3-dehydroquinate synthase, partial [Deltaproteobacteria bacterium]|nr:3-dehydroquinate synthase [Deltaproteobacteria bacterium]
MLTVRLELGDRSYDIMIEAGLVSKIGGCLKAMGFSGRAAIITNPVVERLYAGVVKKSLEQAGLNPVVFIVPDGEEHKSLSEAGLLYDRMIDARMERTSPVIALGGGVIGDLSGFVAATYLRGVPYIQVPTTLLAQVDSSVGGKTAVNHPKGKNLIGAFYQPKAVLIDPLVLKSLDIREKRAGIAEIIKYGVIWDKEFFEFMEEDPDALLLQGERLEKAIERSCAIKASVVSADEREAGVRAILNFGHTFGHAIEAVTGYGTYRHGEAVAVGMCMASDMSRFLGLCPEKTAKRIKALIERAGLPTGVAGLDPEDIIRAMAFDKKVVSERLRFVLVTEIGSVVLKDV